MLEYSFLQVFWNINEWETSKYYLMTNYEYVIDYFSNDSKECAFNLFFKFLESGVTVAILLLFRRPNGHKYMESNAYRINIFQLYNKYRCGTQKNNQDVFRLRIKSA